MVSRLALLGLLLVLSGCGQEEPTPSFAALAARHPADSRLDQLYQTSCKACHANPEAGAPLIGMAKVWTPRWQMG